MSARGGIDQHIGCLKEAFAEDGFRVSRDDVVVYRGRIGIAAKHCTAVNTVTGEPKRAYYVEGNSYQIGYLMGRLAEPAISRMTESFIDRVVKAMIRTSLRGERADVMRDPELRLVKIHRVLIDSLYDMIRRKRIRADLPSRFHREIRGLADGCLERARSEKRATTVTEEELWVLNAGIDCILALSYTGELLRLRMPDLRGRDLQVPLGCNGFAILNDASSDGALFGRDYMFPTGGVFQDVACLTIYNPIDEDGDPQIPFVNMAAPGMIGSIAAMNIHGVAAGVDVAVGGNCNAARPGMNSLLLVRDAVECGSTAETAVRRIIAARRGVTWNYMVVAAGSNVARDRACVVEAGASMSRIPFLSYPRKVIHPWLPDREFLREHRTAEAQQGAMVRWDDYEGVEPYIETFNPSLWERFQRTIDPDAFHGRGRINPTYLDRNCPHSFYFAPLRGQSERVLLTTNHFVIPEMRLCGMQRWANRVFKGRADDSQWRYDELNHRILGVLEREGAVSYDAARDLIDFLSPAGDFPEYYRHVPKGPDGQHSMIYGSVSLFDLKKRTVESHYGYYADRWVRIRLPRYIEDLACQPGEDSKATSA